MPADARTGRHAPLSRFSRLPMDPIAVALAAAQATMAIAVLFVLPGLTLGPLIVTLAVITLAPLAHPAVRASLGRLVSGGRRSRRWWSGGAAGLLVLGV